MGLHVRQYEGTPTGAVFIPFACYEAAANLMTNAALDPFGKILKKPRMTTKETANDESLRLIPHSTESVDSFQGFQPCQFLALLHPANKFRTIRAEQTLAPG